MAARLNPYLHFNGNAAQALEFYRGVFGGTVRANTFREFGNDDPAIADQMMHGQLECENGFTLMASDMPPGVDHRPGNNITISLSGGTVDRDDLLGYWEQLSGDGTVSVPMEKQMWGDEFGQCVDRFGISWLVNIAGAEAG